MHPDRTFRFWFHKDNAYPVGIILLNIVAVGRTPIAPKGTSLEETYQSLKKTSIPWKLFKLADEE